MSTHQSSAVEPLPGWVTTRAAQAAYGDDLTVIAGLIPGLLVRYVMDRLLLAGAHSRGDEPRVQAEVRVQAMECRDDLLETAVILDVLALSYPPGPYLPRPYTDTAEGPDRADELRTDASDIAGELARHDQLHGTSRSGEVPSALDEGCSDAERDGVRAYVRREWRARHEYR